MKKILNALFLTIITLVTFSCSDVPAPYDINGGGNGEGPALTGDGTKENPYDIASAMTKQDNSEAWVMGYIVGIRVFRLMLYLHLLLQMPQIF